VTGTGQQEPPSELRPMLAVAGSMPSPQDPDWAYEMKWDGLRAIAFVRDGQVRLASRTGRDISHAYPELSRWPATVQAGQAILDGEIAAFAGGQWPDFEALQQRMNIGTPAQARVLAAQIPVCYVAFDLLWLDGQSLLRQTYAQRREQLEDLDLESGSWQVPPSFTGESGTELRAVSVSNGLEGIMAKRLKSRYEPGRRSPAWRKIKNVHRQEVVIGGWQPGEGNRAGRIGSLLVGVYDDGALQYSGHVGTGFTEQALGMLARRLAPLRRGSSPFTTAVPTEFSRSAKWVEPALVAEVEFRGWTRSGRLRAPSYKGLRPDKEPADVVREPGQPVL
jgi:bifunctional non-homologous end joining protein LigD